MTLAELARRLGKNRSTISRHAERLGVGTRTKRGIELTPAEVERVAAAVAMSRVGNPNWLAKS